MIEYKQVQRVSREEGLVKTVFVGGGRGCQAVLELLEQGRLEFLDLKILAVVDIREDAPGMQYARKKGWTTLLSIEQALQLDDLDLVIELTGQDSVLNRIYQHLPTGVRVMDHVMAMVFWDLEKVTGNLRQELAHKTALEEQIIKDRAHLQEILDTIPDVVMVLDPQMRITRVNRRYEELTGESRESVEGRHCREAFCLGTSRLIGPDHKKAFEEALAQGQPITVLQQEGPSQDSRYYQITASPVLNDDGQIIYVVQTSREVTEQIVLKLETEESERRFRQIINAVHGIITIKDLRGRYQLANPRAEFAYGLSQNQMLGKTDEELFSKESAQILRRNDRHAISLGGHHMVDEKLVIQDRTLVLISERLPLTDYKGELVGICCVARDVTRELELQNELVQAERLAAIGKLAAGVAHELNNPLTGILTFAEDLMHESSPDNPVYEDYKTIVNETLRCRQIVQDLLDFSRQKAPEQLQMNINQVVTRTLAMVERQASFHNVSFDVSLAQDLPMVNIDPNQIQQAILNLIINARDAMNACGKISIRSFYQPDQKKVYLDIQDWGCGIPEDQLKLIFEPFFTTKGEKGNGLGLPAVASVMEKHNGRIDVTSCINTGSTFRLIFPAAERSTKGERDGDRSTKSGSHSGHR